MISGQKCFVGVALWATAAFSQTPQYTIHDLGPDPGVTITGINNKGQVIGCFRGGGLLLGFRGQPNAAPDPATDSLGSFGGPSSCAYGINNLGEAVGSAQTSNGDYHGFRTRPNAAIDPATDDLGTLDLYPTTAYAINDSGQVTGGSFVTSPFGFPNVSHAFRTAQRSPINPATDDIGALLPHPVLHVTPITSWGTSIKRGRQRSGLGDSGNWGLLLPFGLCI